MSRRKVIVATKRNQAITDMQDKCAGTCGASIHWSLAVGNLQAGDLSVASRVTFAVIGAALRRAILAF